MKELSLNNCRLDKRYDIREQLGRGSYAEIFTARDIMASTTSPHCEVVIKALNVFLQDDLDEDLERTLVENFQNEAIALDRVRHPNVINRLGHGTARDLRGSVFHYLVLEYLSGGDLQSLVRREKIPLKKALGYIEQICAGIGHAHRNGIIHRDIKPQNLLLTADRATVKIADFGVARINLSDSPITRVGTNIYAPPEHSPMFAGQTGTLTFTQLTPAADIYSLAKSVYTIVSGETPRAFANATLTGLPGSISDAEWADDLERVLKKATHPDPRERHQSVEEFWNDLARVREMAAGEESAVMPTFSMPQPHVTRGYTALAPARPHFEAIAETPANLPAVTYSDPAFVRPPETPVLQSSNGANVYQAPAPLSVLAAAEAAVPAATKRRKFRRVAVFLLVICLFAGILYGIASYMRGHNVFSQIRNPFRAQTAVANTDIFLRPAPNTDNDPVGLVTRNSKVRIVNSQNNWYQVDVVEQGRVRDSPPNLTRGWLNGKYLDIDN